MSKKPKYLEKTQRELVHSKFVLDQRYTQTLKPYVSDWFKKMKPLPDFSRIFQDYNKRYFTLNLSEMSLYYSNKERYTINDITYIPFEEVEYISDKPHYALSNQGIEWKDAFGFTIYLIEKYIVLVAQSNEIYMLWLNYFEAIRLRSNNRSILNRTRTPYYSNLFAINFLEPLNKVSQNSQEINKDNEIKSQIEQDDNSNNQNDTNFKQSTPKNQEIAEQDRINSEQKVQQIQEIVANKKSFIEEINISPIIIEEEVKQQPKEKYQEIIFEKQVEQKRVILDFLESEKNSTIHKHEQVVENEQIIQLSHQQTFQEQKNIDSTVQYSFNPPKRLDKRTNSIKQKSQTPNQQNTIKLQTLNIWQFKVDEENLVKSNIKNLDDSSMNKGLFLDLNGQNSQNHNEEIDQPELIIRFDQLDSSRLSEQI